MFTFPHRPHEWSMQREWLKANPDYIELNKQEHDRLVSSVAILEKVLGRKATASEICKTLGYHKLVAKAYCKNKILIMEKHSYPTVHEAYIKAVREWKEACDRALFDYYVKPYGIECSFDTWKNVLEEIMDPDGDIDSYDRGAWEKPFLDRREQAAKTVWFVIGSFKLGKNSNNDQSI